MRIWKLVNKKIVNISCFSNKYDVYIQYLYKALKSSCTLIYEYLKVGGILLILAILKCKSY